jgi:hypothetical protein
VLREQGVPVRISCKVKTPDHLLARTLRVDWQNRWLAWAPGRLRGAYFCHLVAPEYLRRLVLGEARAPAWPR